MTDQHRMQAGIAPVPPYRSLTCRIGAHGQCTEDTSIPPPRGLPVIYETCACFCHRQESGRGASGEAADA